MSTFWVHLLFLAAAFFAQFHILPGWGTGAYTPDLLVAAVSVLSMTYGPVWGLPFALVFGIGADVVFGYSYGMYLLPMVLCAWAGQYLSDLGADRPYLAALPVGGAALLARLFRSIFMAGAGHGALLSVALLPSIVSALLTALCAFGMILDMDRRQRAGHRGRYDL